MDTKSYDAFMSRVQDNAHGVARKDVTPNGDKSLATPKRGDISTPDKLVEYLSRLDLAVQETYDLFEAIDLNHMADAVQAMTRKLDIDIALYNRAAASHIRSLRKIGLIIQQMPKAKAGKPNRFQPETDYAPSYADMGLDKNLPYRSQLLARVDNAKIEDYIAEQSEGGRLSVGGVLAQVKNHIKKNGGDVPPGVGHQNWIEYVKGRRFLSNDFTAAYLRACAEDGNLLKMLGVYDDTPGDSQIYVEVYYYGEKDKLKERGQS